MVNEKPEKEEVKAVNLNGYFKIDIVSESIYLTIYPPQEGGQPVLETTVANQLKFRGIKNYHYQQMSSIVHEASGTSVKIAEISGLELEECEGIRIEVSEDQMEVWLELDSEIIERLSFEEIINKLKERGINYGFNYDEIRKACETPKTKVKCAQGLLPENGEDAYVKYFVDLESKGKPKELEDGRVDFKDTNMYTAVEAGAAIAEKVPATLGTPGIDVFGQQIAARAGKDTQLPLGKNTAIKDHQMIATIAGQLILEQEKINVVPIIEINGDVDMSTGNINFTGNVNIRGSVIAGFSVKATGIIEINGSVNGGHIEGKTVIVHRGIQGAESIVKAKEDIVAKFVENANVQAGRDIKISGVILHSDVCAGRAIVVDGRKGLIAGGTVIAGEEIKVRNIGTPLSITTDLQVGVNPILRDEYNQLRKDIKSIEENLEQAQKALTVLKNIDKSQMSPEKRELLLKTTKMQFTLAGQLENMRNRIAEIELAFEDMRYGKIKASEFIYPGTKLMIGSLVKVIKEPQRFAVFYAEDGDIKTGSFK